VTLGSPCADGSEGALRRVSQQLLIPAIATINANNCYY
jgi:hypothetical protein